MHRVLDFARAADDAAAHHPSLILLDVDLPGGVDSLSLLGELVRRAPESRVVIFTGYPSGALAMRAMARGAWGVVSKGVRSDRLIRAIHRVLAGDAVIELEA